jgi:hypothetical protein
MQDLLLRAKHLFVAVRVAGWSPQTDAGASLASSLSRIRSQVYAARPSGWLTVTVKITGLLALGAMAKVNPPKIDQRQTLPVRLSRGGCSFQFGRTSIWRPPLLLGRSLIWWGNRRRVQVRRRTFFDFSGFAQFSHPCTRGVVLVLIHDSIHKGTVSGLAGASH